MEKGSAYHPKPTYLSGKHGGGDFMACVCMAASQSGSLFFIDVTHSGSSRMNFEVYKDWQFT